MDPTKSHCRNLLENNWKVSNLTMSLGLYDGQSYLENESQQQQFGKTAAVKAPTHDNSYDRRGNELIVAPIYQINCWKFKSWYFLSPQSLLRRAYKHIIKCHRISLTWGLQIKIMIRYSAREPKKNRFRLFIRFDISILFYIFGILVFTGFCARNFSN